MHGPDEKSPLFFRQPPRSGAKLEAEIQGKANELCCFAMVQGTALVISGVVDMVALLGSVEGGFCRSSAARAVVNQVTAAVEDKPGPATRHIIYILGSEIALEADLCPSLGALRYRYVMF